MQSKKLSAVRVLLSALIPLALLGCPEKAAETKPDPAVTAKPPASGAIPAKAGAAPTAPAKSGGW